MELKHFTHPFPYYTQASSNRTFMELKHVFVVIIVIIVEF